MHNKSIKMQRLLNKKYLLAGIGLLSIIIVILLVLTLSSPAQKEKPSPGLKKPEKKNIFQTLSERLGLSKPQEQTKTEVISGEFFKQKLETQSTDTDEVAKKVKSAGKDHLLISRKIIYWILSYRKLERIPNTPNKTLYPYSVVCEGKSCQSTGTDRQVSIPVMLAAWQYSRFAEDKSVESIVKKDIQDLKGQIFQPRFLHCYLLYEMINSGVFEEDRQTLQKMCTDAVYFNQRGVSILANKADPNQIVARRYIDKIQGRIFELNQDSEFQRLIPKDESEFTTYSSYVAEFATRYKFTNSPEDLRRAKTYLDLVVEYLSQDPSRVGNTRGLPLMSMGIYRLFEATGNPEYEKLFFLLLGPATSNKREDLINLVHIALLDDLILQKTGLEQYRQDLQAILNYLVDNNFYLYGITSNKNAEKKYYYINENALVAYLIAKYGL